MALSTFSSGCSLFPSTPPIPLTPSWPLAYQHLVVCSRNGDGPSRGPSQHAWQQTRAHSRVQPPYLHRRPSTRLHRQQRGPPPCWSVQQPPPEVDAEEETSSSGRKAPRRKSKSRSSASSQYAATKEERPKAKKSVVKNLVRMVETTDVGILPSFVFLVQAALLGLITGLAIITFKTLINVMATYTYGNFLTSAVNTFGGGKPLSVAMALIPAMGGIVVALIRQFSVEFPPGLSGQIEEIERQRPFDLKGSVLKTVSAAATLGSGCSLGPEGPSVEIGVACSRVVSAKMSPEQQRQLLVAGAAAGVAAGFNAPISGVFFALEIAQGTMEPRSLPKVAGALLCAVISALVAKIGLNEELALRPAPYYLENPLVELPLYLGLGITSGLVAILFKFCIEKADAFFKGKMKGAEFMADLPSGVKPILGGLICGLTGIFYPQVLFFGYETLDGLIANQSYTITALLTLLLLKALMTSICVGSGLVGGLFAPSLFLGATAGSSYQKIINGLIQGGLVLGDQEIFSIAGPPAYAMVGAASVLASMFRAPLTASLLLFELTRDYDILLPLMASAGLGSLLTDVVDKQRKMGEAQAATTLASTAAATTPQGEELVGQIEAILMDDESKRKVTITPAEEIAMPRIEQLLYEIKAKDALMRNIQVLPPETSLEDAVIECCRAHTDVVLVADGQTRELVGVATIRDLNRALERWYERADKRYWSDITPLHDQLQQAMVGVTSKRDEAGDALEIFAGIVKQMKRPTGLTLGRVCDTNYPTVVGEDVLVRARDLLNAGGVAILPVVKEGGSKIALGVIDEGSIRLAARMQETMEIMSKSMFSTRKARETVPNPTSPPPPPPPPSGSSSSSSSSADSSGSSSGHES